MERNNKECAEYNKVDTKRSIQNINETKHWFFENINKIDKPLAKLTKLIELAKTKETQRIPMEYLEKQYTEKSRSGYIFRCI
jgi:hypothetical protein